MIKLYYLFLLLCFLQSSAFSQEVGDVTKKECLVQSYQYYNQLCSTRVRCLWDKYVRNHIYKCPDGYNKSSYIGHRHNLIVTCFLGNKTVPPQSIYWYRWETQVEFYSEYVSKDICISKGYRDFDNPKPPDNSQTCPNVKVKINTLPYKTGTVKLKCNNN